MNTQNTLALCASLMILTAPTASFASAQTPAPATEYHVAQMTENSDGPVMRNFNNERSEENDYTFDAYPDGATDDNDMDRSIDNNLLFGSVFLGSVILFMILLFMRQSFIEDEA